MGPKSRFGASWSAHQSRQINIAHNQINRAHGFQDSAEMEQTMGKKLHNDQNFEACNRIIDYCYQ